MFHLGKITVVGSRCGFNGELREKLFVENSTQTANTPSVSCTGRCVRRNGFSAGTMNWAGTQRNAVRIAQQLRDFAIHGRLVRDRRLL
jgi:hypothetical protein